MAEPVSCGRQLGSALWAGRALQSAQESALQQQSRSHSRAGCGTGRAAQVHAFLVPDPGQVCQIVNGTALPIGLGTASSVTFCQGGKMANASVWLGIAGLFLISVLMSRSFKGPIILGACARPAPRPDAQAGLLACLGSRA